MCRLLGYIGETIVLDYILTKPEHSLIEQSYQPREMTAGLLNADGFGIGWYHPEKDIEPFTYKNILPIWSDANLPHLCRYIESNCLVATVRSATTGQAVDLSNSQPFTHQNLLFSHNGFIEKFRKSLYRPIRNQLNDEVYQAINGTTDSEHIFALIINELQAKIDITLENALYKTLINLKKLAQKYQVDFAANLLLSDGKRLVACRSASRSPVPSLYWLRDDPNFPNAVIIASEPLFEGNWNSLAENSIIIVGEDLDIQIDRI
ncbi:ergothioneine biosynthesis protein EgtC [[Phormidium ambiguum] IAM M-71]|uniref:Ergothioneine biosynthesis protein EgtC n=1 Tax=[Phormidium ambiguum] IAM M-71 TaxID=454136 RepID=A0A1U7ISS7_9CYAN|nr:ergothioneine biosynthesis protein EgtC [Phormidium ambiguum]OKH40509.1 ergothioneine biosynthesis protein EgtC [Phormidium ambiguum IAM M-71]